MFFCEKIANLFVWIFPRVLIRDRNAMNIYMMPVKITVIRVGDRKRRGGGMVYTASQKTRQLWRAVISTSIH